MTYTFKLARRLAVSRTLGMLPALVLFAACSGGDTTAPDPSPAQAAVSINPSIVTVETNQLIRFLATSRNSAGDSIAAPVVWSATGGTILPDGRFSAAASGTFLVIGRMTDRPEEPVDTSIVDVVRRQPTLKAIHVLPATVTLTTGMSQSFFAKGILANGQPVAVGVIWRAEGGSIDAGGNYVAGDSAGTYRVIATNTARTISDTSVITLTPPAPPPPPTTPPPPVLESVTLSPGSATLAPSATRQFAAYGRTTGGDSVAANVVFTATGGTVTPAGLFTAGSGAGIFRVVATAGQLADTSSVTVTVPSGSGPPSGTPYGVFNLFTSATTTQPGPFSLSHTWDEPYAIASRITAARNLGVKLMLVMTGGHSGYLKPGGTTSTGTQFDMVKWKARMDLFNTPAVKEAIAEGVRNGTIIGASVMDEPNHRDWGGVVTKAALDEMARYVKGYFPTLPVGVVIVHWWRPTERYRDIDFIVDQYDWWQSPNGPGGGQSGNITGWRDAALAMAQANGISIAFSMNLIAGGIQDLTSPDRLEAWRCPTSTTGGRGYRTPTCRMHASQVRDWGKILGVAGCALLMWRYEDVFMAKLDNQESFKAVAERLSTVAPKSCARP
jgi:hypothetical protein